MSAGGAAVLAAFAGACVALSMVLQRYALTYPTYDVKLLCCHLKRPVVWTIGFAFYQVANTLFALSALLGLLSLNATLFTLLIIWNMLFARFFLGEVLTAPKVVGAVMLVSGAGISVLGAPVNAENEFTVRDVGNLIADPAGLTFVLLMLFASLATSAAVLWYERTFKLTEEEEEVRVIRRRQLAFSIIVEAKHSLAFSLTPAQVRWRVSKTKLQAMSKIQSSLRSFKIPHCDPTGAPHAGAPYAVAPYEQDPAFAPSGVEAGKDDPAASPAGKQKEAVSASTPSMDSSADEVGVGPDGGEPEPPPSPPSLAPLAADPGLPQGGAIASRPLNRLPPLSDRSSASAPAVAHQQTLTRLKLARAAAASAAAPAAALAPDSGRNSRSSKNSGRNSRNSKNGDGKSGTSKAAKKTRRPPAWLDKTMAVVYPMSLGLLEGVTQVTMKCIMAMFFGFCMDQGWPSDCYKLPWLFVCISIFAVVGVLTVIWLKIVYTRYEVTSALPIEYGTVHLCSVLAGVIFFQEYKYMLLGAAAGAAVEAPAAQFATVFTGLFVVMIGVAVSSMSTLPFPLNRCCSQQTSRRVHPART